MKIPRIIHQIWSSKRIPLPSVFCELAETWKEKHPDWQYILWDDLMMEDFMKNNFPQYMEMYNHFLYDIQRWDVIRYLILYKMGGMYVDFDMECLENIEPLLKGSCCFGTDIAENIVYASLIQGEYLNNTFMATIPEHSFFKEIIEHVFDKSQYSLPEDTYKLLYVLQTSGSIMLSNLNYTCNMEVHVIPSQYISPFSITEAQSIRLGDVRSDWEDRLQDAYAVHYFMGTWGYLF